MYKPVTIAARRPSDIKTWREKIIYPLNALKAKRVAAGLGTHDIDTQLALATKTLQRLLTTRATKNVDIQAAARVHQAVIQTTLAEKVTIVAAATKRYISGE